MPDYAIVEALIRARAVAKLSQAEVCCTDRHNAIGHCAARGRQCRPYSLDLETVC